MTSVLTDPSLDAPAWNRAVQRGLAAYILSRILVLLGVGVGISAHAVRDRWEDKVPVEGLHAVVRALDSWDGHWYLDVVRSGYPHHVMPNVTYFVPDARAAFFPLYPRMVHYIDVIFPGGPVSVALGINLILGATFVYLVGQICRDIFDARTAEKAMILTALFPGSFVLSMAYSEALLLTIACLCFLALQRKQWLWAGVLASLGSACRPNGIALGAACGVAAIIAITEDRQWRASIAPLLAPLGFVGFMWFLRQHTDENWAWFRVQGQAWREGASFGVTAAEKTLSFFVSPTASPTTVLTAGSVIAMLGALYLMRRHPIPVIYVAYSAVILVLMLVPATVTARPRFLFTAFPLIFPVARALRDDDDKWWLVLCSLLACGLVTVMGIYGVRGAIP